MLYNQTKSCVKSCKKILLFKKNPLFSQKTHCFPIKPIVFQHVHFLSHCFEMKNYHCVLVGSVPMFRDQLLLPDEACGIW